ncbi:MAG: maleylpyruvate isomerase family mycothiol-dependent enzyme [Acidimicrobiia bacterium]|nr:maleylpyruvate isomerase family mycothiol-dependent enzyme [Acidimicrobiia bacterium]
MRHHLDYSAAVRRDGLALAEAAEAAGPQAPIAGCPGWDVAELVWHLTEVHCFWAEIVARRLLDPEAVPRLERPGTFPALLARFRSGVEHLAATLAAADPTTPVWTWARQKDAGFVIRHQAQETAVHRWDAETAAGRAFGIDPDLAADAVDEFLEHTAAFRGEGARPIGGTVHLHATDAAGEWTVAEDEAGALVISREHAKGDAAMRGPASDLLLVLYRRRGPEVLETLGDPGVLERFLARPDLG